MREYYDPENPEFEYHFKEEDGRGVYHSRPKPKGFLRRNIMLLVLFMNIALVSVVTTVIGPRLQDKSDSITFSSWEFTLKGYPWEDQLLISLEVQPDGKKNIDGILAEFEIWGQNREISATIEGFLHSNIDKRQFFRTSLPLSDFSEKLNCLVKINGQEREFFVIIDTQEE